MTSLGIEKAPSQPTKDSETERRMRGAVRQSLHKEGKKNILWEEQTIALVCGVGCPTKIEIDKAKKIKPGACL